MAKAAGVDLAQAIERGYTDLAWTNTNYRAMIFMGFKDWLDSSSSTASLESYPKAGEWGRGVNIGNL